jgi:hypothetical protein
MCINGKIISVRKKGEEYSKQIRTNCGKCHICHNQRAISWAYRCQSQYEYNPKGCYFVTLTLSDENLTDAPDKKEIARFHKSLRKHYERNNPGNQFKFFLVSEYGYQTERLHYHAIYFNLPYDNETPYIQISNELARIWGKGIAYVKPFDISKVMYCLKYLHKDKELGNIQVFSKNLGVISDEMKEYINQSSNFENFKVRLGDKNVNLPRYFRKKYMHDDNKERFSDYFSQKDIEERKKLNFSLKLHNFELQAKRFGKPK